MMRHEVRVLLIDDDEDHYLLTADMLTRALTARYAPAWAGTYQEGLTALLRGDHDACLLDYRLDNRDGVELLREAMAAGCLVPVIMLTGERDPSIDLAAMDAGAADYLVKGELDLQVLERSIRYAIRHKTAERELKQHAEALETANQRLTEMHEELEQRNRELSAPLIPISDRVMVMPLIGAIDPRRADGISLALLEGMRRARARVAILDVTGVPKVDASTADALIRTANRVRLLGGEVVLTGIRPDVAVTLASLGVDLRGIVTRGTLQGGIDYAMSRR